MTTTYAIHSLRCWIDGALTEATVEIRGDKIYQVRPGHRPHSRLIELGDAVLMPGLIDPHIHINEPGRTEWEGFDTATRAAAWGGITTIVDMPLNSSPVVTTLEALELKTAASRGKLHVNCGFWAGYTGGALHDLEALLDAGCLGVKVFLVHSGIDEFPPVTEEDLHHVMPLIARKGSKLLAHCELAPAIPGPEPANPESYPAYLASRPKQWENEAIQMMIRLCEQYRCPTHIVHLSSAEAIPPIADARKRGLPLTVETCPHYIYFHAEDIPDGHPLYKCAPPIRERANNEALAGAIKAGIIDFLATDHSPAPPGLKELDSGNLMKAWGGIAGLQFLLPASWTALKGQLSLEAFIPLVTSRPARFLSMDHCKGHLKEGYDADFTIWNPEKEISVEAGIIQHRHKATPYIGRALTGKMEMVIVNGQIVYQDGKLVQLRAG
ncbi:MAG: allantoinase AllB, partial [Phaeodactylibacter sp.]|nr:allantoinase AllB [Phaeodactylibacter sp.]